VLLEDFLVAENSPARSDTAALNNSDRVMLEANENIQGLGSISAPNHQHPNGKADGGQRSIDMLTQASTEEAEAMSAVWRAAREASMASSEGSLSDEKEVESEADDKSPVSGDLDGTDSSQPDVKLHPRAVYLMSSISLFLLSCRDTFV
jgi:protein phosphatase